MNDLRFAFRQLLKNPGFTLVALAILAICLGANLAILAVVDAVLIRPLPFPGANRLVTMFNTYPGAGIERAAATLANYYERRGNLSAFSDIAIFRPGTAIVGDTGATKQNDIMRVSPEFFQVLQVELAQGRGFTDDEMTYQTDGVAILTDSYWRHEFNADPNILQRQLRVDGLQKTIVGVLPPSFRFLSSSARLYFPLSSNPEDRVVKQRHSNQDFEMIGRLKPGVSLAAAQAQIDADNAAHAAEYPDPKMVEKAGFRTMVKPLQADHARAVRPTLFLLQAGVFLLLLMGAVNLVNLILIRASSRTREMAIRLSLGASRRHVIRQIMTEAMLLMSLGGACALVVGAAGTRLLSALGARQLPLGAEIAFDRRLAIVAVFAVAFLGICIGGVISWFNLRGRPNTAFRTEGRGATSGLAAQRLRHSCIVAQVAIALVLLIGGGLLGLSLKRVMAINPGFPPDHLLTGRIALPWKSYPDWPQRLAFIQRLMENVQTQPGVSVAGIINTIPFTDEHLKTAFAVKGYVPKPGESLQGHYFYGVGGEAFAALGIPLREGRFLHNTDSDSKVCVVDEDFARKYCPPGKALGKSVFVGAKPGPDSEAFTIVGIVGPMKQTELAEPGGQGAVYFPYRFRTDVDLFAVVRTTQAPEFFSRTVQKLVRGIDPDLPITDLRSMQMRIADSMVVRRSPVFLAAIFAAIALLLAAIGTYGVLAFAVSQRRREIGVRMAVGAQPGQISVHFLYMGLRLLAAGLVLGLGGAWAAGRAMRSMLFHMPSMPLPIITLAVLIIGLVCLLACWLPARRAARIDPMQALRYE